MIHRVGRGRVRHLQTRYLCHQQALRKAHFNVVRCGTKENPSGLGTKVLEKEAMTRCMNNLAIVPATRGAIIAVLAQVSGADTQMASIVDGCCPVLYKRIMGATAHDQCGSKRIYHSNETALASGHEQMRRVGSADAFQRRGAGGA